MEKEKPCSFNLRTEIQSSKGLMGSFQLVGPQNNFAGLPQGFHNDEPQGYLC